jgi:uncharacterized protein (DUF2126 family)
MRGRGDRDLTELSEEQLLALQLSHNAIAGKDDPNIPRQALRVDRDAGAQAQRLTDDAFSATTKSSPAWASAAELQRKLQIVFLPEEKAAFLDLVARVEKAKRQPDTLVGRLEDFDKFFDALVTVKEEAQHHQQRRRARRDGAHRGGGAGAEAAD